MSKDLTTSAVARQNVLNNQYALNQLETHLALGGLHFGGELLFTRPQVAEILDIDERTVRRYLADHGDELRVNGYRVLTGKDLKNIKLAYVKDVNVLDMLDPKAPSLGVFSFRTVLNLAMLVTESARAKAIRSRMLDIVIDVIAAKAGGHTKYINQRDQDYLPAAYAEDSYRKQFTDALRDHLDMGQHKYVVYTNKVYQIVFLERAQEYKKILKLAAKDRVRDTMYAEVLNAIASFEHGLAVELKNEAVRLERKLKSSEFTQLIESAASSPYMKPMIENARTCMASRDLGFRDALHQRLENYIQAIPEGDFERFLGEKAKSLEEQLADPEILAVLKRLKDR